jgi:hypothetical protein
MLKPNASIAMLSVTFALLTGCSQVSTVQHQRSRSPWGGSCDEVARTHERAAEEGNHLPKCMAVALKVERLLFSRTIIAPPALMQCQMIASLDHWLARSVAPAARFYLGEQLAEIQSLGSFNCRSIKGIAPNRLSEHGFANAIDLKGFRFASGTTIDVANGWQNRDPRVRAFMRAVHSSACHYFTTVLGPDSNARHADHFHLDLAYRGRDGIDRICQ